MSKDPAILWYVNDWVGGTISFTRAHKGAYMDLLMAQHTQGHLSLQDIRDTLGQDFDSMWEQKLRSKFIQDCNGLYYNKKLEEVQQKRKAFTDSRKKNLESKKLHKGPLMGNGNGNGKENRKRKCLTNPGIILPWNEPEFKKIWEAWFRFRLENRWKKYSKMGEKAALTKLERISGGDLETAIRIIWQSIENSWQGLFELKQNRNGAKKPTTEEDIRRYFDEKYGKSDN